MEAVAQNIDIGLPDWRIARFEITVHAVTREQRLLHDWITWERTGDTPSGRKRFHTAYTWPVG
jgi:hypothetical protein